MPVVGPGPVISMLILATLAVSWRLKASRQLARDLIDRSGSPVAELMVGEQRQSARAWLASVGFSAWSNL